MQVFSFIIIYFLIFYLYAIMLSIYYLIFDLYIFISQTASYAFFRFVRPFVRSFCSYIYREGEPVKSLNITYYTYFITYIFYIL